MFSARDKAHFAEWFMDGSPILKMRPEQSVIDLPRIGHHVQAVLHRSKHIIKITVYPIRRMKYQNDPGFLGVIGPLGACHEITIVFKLLLRILLIGPMLTIIGA